MNRQCVLTDTLLAAIRLPDICAISEGFRLSFSSVSGMKWEPLIDLQSGEVHGHEILSLLPGGVNSDAFFSILSPTAMVELFQLQIYLSQQMTTYPCFLNLSVSVLINKCLCQHLANRDLKNIVVEIQDTESLANLSQNQSKALNENLRLLMSAGADVWADDVNPEQIPSLQKMLLPLSGVKLSRRDFQLRSQNLNSLVSVICKLKLLAPRVVVEGIETPSQYLMATLAGATYGQGYMWPAEVMHYVRQEKCSDLLLLS
ncbi:EAL domain-containing protein [Citrobacter cronae]|uniref:EAL domain-containing protein n=1 Tax=Citrobacter cronae TaxID=1748967 RepID=UPI0018FFD449|nr:EAL domain-containing protein [Citrobacter cronae]MBJ8362571.1 EAL domain-containing protein [Citrobacter cronae]